MNPFVMIYNIIYIWKIQAICYNIYMKKMNVHKKKFLIITTLTFILLTLIEYIKYFFSENNIFGLIYLILNIFIIFLIIPITKNYNRYYSGQRISKLIIIIIVGLFCSFGLNHTVLKLLSYTDASIKYIDSIFVIKNILKTIIYVLLIIFTYYEFTLQQLIQNKQSSEQKKIIKKKKIIKRKKSQKEKLESN